MKTAILLLVLICPALAGNSAESWGTLYGEREKQVLSTSTKDDDAALAADVLAGAAEVTGDRDLQILLYEKAYELGRRGTPGYRTALAALTKLGAAVPERLKGCEMLRIDILNDAHRYAQGGAKVGAGEELVHERIRVARRRMVDSEWEAAKKLLWDAQVTAGKIDSARKGEAEILRRAVEERIGRLAEAAELAEKLKAAPGDAETRLRLVRLCVIALNEPAKAAEHVGPGVPKEWANRIALAAMPDADLTEAALLTLGDWYRELAGETKGVPSRLMWMRSRDLFAAYAARHGTEDETRLRAKLRVAEAQTAIFEIDRKLVRRAGSLRWVDAIQAIDPARDATRGRWVKTDGVLYSDGRDGSIIWLPLRGTGGYELQISFMRHSGDAAPVIVLPCGEHGGALVVGLWGGDKTGLHEIHRRSAKGNETTHVEPIVAGRPYRVHVRVDPDGKNVSVRVRLNGQEIISWRGKQEWFRHGLRKPDRGIGVEAHKTRVEFRSIKVRMLSGEPELTTWE